VRTLSDDTLVVFLSDSHIGGDEGRDIFETPDDLASLFDSLEGHHGPVELVLAGDFFDFLRVAEVPEGTNRASATTARGEYRELFAALRRFADRESRRVVYLPGNHDAEMWWNKEIQAELRDQGLVHEFALTYVAAFESEPDRIIYCEHGNQFDPANAKHDYTDPLDKPLGDYVVTELAPRLAAGGTIGGLRLRDVDRVFPLTTIPDWASGRLFYALATQTVRWLLLPLLVAYVVYEVIAYALGAGGALDLPAGIGVRRILFVEVGIDILFLLLISALFLFAVRRTVTGARPLVHMQLPGRAEREASGASSEDVTGGTVGEIRTRLERGEPPPLGRDLQGEIGVFVSGHTHAPSMTEFDGRGGWRCALVNSGCWLRQLQPVAARFGAPPVYVGRFVQTHVRVYRTSQGIEVELWEHPRPSPRQLRLGERLAAAGRMPPDPEPDASPRVRARTLAGPSGAPVAASRQPGRLDP
jgi:UDP-2,3-diacylglucosamine pyrophosphatase LpxH